MEIFGIGLWAAVGFVLASYAVVGNDALQTLGTFINSNRRLHWSVLFAFAASVLVVTFTYGWIVNGGDPSFGRLSNTEKYPPIEIQWYHVLPPLVLLVITRLGIPVSTSFMVLTIFATGAGLASMLEKSLFGYALAFVVGGGIYLIASRLLEPQFEKSDISDNAPRGLILIAGSLYLTVSQWLIAIKDNREAAAEAGVEPSAAMDLLVAQFTDSSTLLMLIGILVVIEITANLLANRSRGLYWVTVQWVTTGYLWSVWLIQDFANIFVFLPRELTLVQGFGAMVVIAVLLGYTFWNDGGPVQRILRTKANVTDIRSATLIDLIYASLLFFFKEYSDIPMSTTWVFLGLIAGRQFAFALMVKAIEMSRSIVDVTEDIAKAYVGVVISINLAVGLPYLGALTAGNEAVLFASQNFMYFVIVANVALIPAAIFAFAPAPHRAEEQGPITAGILRWAVIIAAMHIGLATAFFALPIN